MVVSTILKNISQCEGLSHILWKITFMFQTNNQFIILKVNLLRISEHRPNAWKEVFLLANLG